MAWTPTTPNSIQVRAELGKALPNNSTVQTDQIDFLKPNTKVESHWASLTVKPTGTIVGTNVDVNIYGRWESGGTNVLLVADALLFTSFAAAATYQFDVNKYKFPYYSVELETDANETGSMDVIWTYRD